MKILVACEESGRVRDAFLARGHDAVSCDLQPTSSPGPHYQGDVFDILGDGWDMMIAHPPCTYLAGCGARWFYHPEDKRLPVEQRRPHPDFPNRQQDFDDAVEFFLRLKNAPIERICLENSLMLGRAMDIVGKYTQTVQPWMFGSPYTKRACLWLKNLPPLVPTHSKPETVIAKCHRMAPSADRARLRSQTEPEVAEAMARTWGSLAMMKAA